MMQVEYLEICSAENDSKRPHVNVMQGEAAVGRILLRTTSSPAEVMQLQSIQAVLAFLVKSDDIVTDAMEGTVQIGVRNHAWCASRHYIAHPLVLVGASDSELTLSCCCVR